MARRADGAALVRGRHGRGVQAVPPRERPPAPARPPGRAGATCRRRNCRTGLQHSRRERGLMLTGPPPEFHGTRDILPSCGGQGSLEAAQPDVTASARFACNQLRTKLPIQPSGEQLNDYYNSLSSDTLAKMEELCPGLSKDFDRALSDSLVASADDEEVAAPPAVPEDDTDGSY